MKTPKKCKRGSKEERIRKCLLAHNQLTPLEALKYFGHMRLADVVYDLRKEGHDVKNVGRPGGHANYYIPRKVSLLNKSK